ncbi:MAG: ABC transporter permease subunit [Candidatus Eremiobacteraeota bacterium]|nr:ABC transporter permease subunit [Candidatus Eremiobacteraeota bacterium]
MQATLQPAEALKRPAVRLSDIAVILGVLTILAFIAKTGAGMLVHFTPPKVVPHVDLDPHDLPYYAARSTLRMFVALIWSIVFTFAYGYAAARSKRAERVLIPALDILQSVPVLGFLSITVTGFIALFPGSLLGLEFASIFAIFTAQVWNMTFSFYQSLRTVPKELEEAAALYRLSSWQRFTKLEVPWSMIGLVWNAMMSFGGSWFFLAASEAISVLNQKYTLPGVGSYVAAAVDAKDLHALGWAALTIAIVIVIVDQFFWRPVVAWADKFRFEQSASSDPPRSWVYDLVHESELPQRIGRFFAPLRDGFNAAMTALTKPRDRWPIMDSPWSDRIFNAALIVITTGLIALGVTFVLKTVGLAEVGRVILLGFATMARVLVLLVFATLVWTPIGVAIGFSPRLARVLQPVALFLASFPANFVFPFATLAFITYHIPINWGSILLMALGSQWYILFNAIAGAQTIPTDMREMADDIELRGWLRWHRLIIPGIFPSWVTGAITASGGAWNASIVSEIVSWGSTTLTAFGLGSYIADATNRGDWPRITLGVGVMAIFVVVLNRTVWRRLYRIGETRFAR